MGSPCQSRRSHGGQVTTIGIASIIALVCGLVLPGLPGNSFAAEYPTKPITIIVPFSPGGSNDVQARLIAKGLADQLLRQRLQELQPLLESSFKLIQAGALSANICYNY